MQDSLKFSCKNQSATESLGADLAKRLSFPSIVYLFGELGAGKTTLCQAIIHAFGYQGVVTSPTYNLIQEYPVAEGVIYHMDLYRVDDPSEIEFLGIEDLLNSHSLLLIEWPQKGLGYLPAPSHEIMFEKQSGLPNDMREIRLNYE